MYDVRRERCTMYGGSDVRRRLFLMGGEGELGGVEEVLPDDIRRGTKGRERIEIRLRHPYTKRGVLLSEGLSGGDGRDTCHGLRRRCRVDEDILIVRAFGGGGEVIANEFAEPELGTAGNERAEEEPEDSGELRVERCENGLGDDRHKDDNRRDPEIKGDLRKSFRQLESCLTALRAVRPLCCRTADAARPLRCRTAFGCRIFAAVGSVVGKAEEPRGKERSEQEGCYTAYDEQESRPESHVCRRVDKREESRYDDCRGEVREERESREVLYRAAEFAGDDRRSGGGGHNETHHQSLRQNRIARERHKDIIDREREDYLRCQHHPMPFVQAQVEGVHLAESEEKHEENKPR